MDNDQFLDAYLNTLETSEGAGGGDTVTGMATREYGVKDLLGVKEEDYEGNPKGLAKAVAQKNIDELIRMGIDWDNLPLPMKFNSLDIQFNMGSLNKKAPKYFNALKSGNYEAAIKQSLDAIGAYDPKRKGERPTKGIAIRRAMFYNLAAKDLGIPTITSINAINQDNDQKSAKVTYNMSEGAAIPITYAFQSLHSTTKPGKAAVSAALDIETTPKTDEDKLGFTELEQYVPATAKPESSPAAPDAVSKGQPSAERAITIDYEGEMPDVGDDVPLPAIEEKDVAPDTTDAIPTAEPEEKGLFSRAISGVGEFLFGDDDDTSAKPKVDKNEIIRRSLLKELDTSGVPNMNEGGLASGEIDYSVVDDEYELPTPSDKAREQMKAMGLDAPSILSPRTETRTAEEIDADRKSLAEVAPVTGDVLAVKDYPEDISIAKNIIKQGVDEGELSSVLSGVAYAGLSTIGLLPAATGVGAGAKIAKKATKDKLKKELVDEFGTDGASKVVDTVGEASQPIRVTNVIEPKKTVKAYKLFKVDKQGNLYPLFVKMGDNKPIELNKWTKAEAGEINKNTGKVKSSLGDLAYRPGFHAGDLPLATHIGGKAGDVTKPNYRPDNQVWAEVEMADDVDWQSIALDRARIKKDGTIDVKTAHITDQLPEGGHYRYKTNPNMTGNWLIGGELKVNRILTNDEVKSINDAAGVADLPRLSELNMAEGGTVMKRQMDMFDEGGLLDEGGTIDEQSGNDVPPGSLKEEVRDDIPAQLSEGEFVFPADVVRYWGLEKLMQMRQEAKAGLSRMEAMGQMGNSEEATIPDDLPFTLDDLDMKDDPMEFQVGGLVPNQFGITEQPSQFATYNPQPYVAPTIPAGQPIQQQPLQTGFTPLTTPSVPTDGTVVPTFEQLLPTTTGRYDELKEYINNDTGQTMTIPFVDGKPIYPIPEGFVEVETDIVETVETPSTAVPTAQTVSPDDDGTSNYGTDGNTFTFGGTAFKGTVTGNYRSDISFQGLTFGQARQRMTAGVGQFFDFKQNKTPELPKGATAIITNIKPPGKDPDGRDARVIRAKVQLDSNFFNRNIANTNVSKRQDLARTLDWVRKNYEREFLDDKDNVINAELAFRTMQQEEKNAETAKQVRAGNFGSQDDSSPTGYTRGSVIDRAIKDAQQMVRDDDDEAYSPVSVSPADLEAARQSAPTLAQAQASDRNQVSGIAQDTYEDDSAGFDYSDFDMGSSTLGSGSYDAGRFGNKGMLVTRKKPKSKKMKRGGLASKK